MKTNFERVVSFPMAGIHACFLPGGLPLVQKYAGAKATTSVLVRGAAGTGKSFLAVALARGIAQMRGGTVLYVSLEAVPADARYKAITLDVPQEQVTSQSLLEVQFDEREPEFVIAYLPDSATDADLSSTGAREQLAYGQIADLARREAQREGTKSLAVVIVDGLSPPDTATDAERRPSLLALFALLESQGVSPIVVEEVGTPWSDRTTFLADCVFETSVAPNEDGRLQRYLSLSKSRYSVSTPGPYGFVHDDNPSTGLTPRIGNLNRAQSPRR